MTANRLSRCLFCLGGEQFTSEEHVWPESLGNVDVILPPGVVCDDCNNDRLAPLDAALIEFPPVAESLVIKGVKNKGRGKPGRVVEREFSTVGLFPTTAADGTHSVYFRQATTDTLPSEGRLKYHLTEFLSEREFSRVARAILKIGLELMALQEGKEAAMVTALDPVRRAVLEGYSGMLAIGRSAKADEGLRGGYAREERPPLSADQFGAWVDIYGNLLGACWPSPPHSFPNVIPELDEAAVACVDFPRKPDKARGQKITWHTLVGETSPQSRERDEAVAEQIRAIEAKLGRRGRPGLDLSFLDDLGSAG